MLCSAHEFQLASPRVQSNVKVIFDTDSSLANELGFKAMTRRLKHTVRQMISPQTSYEAFVDSSVWADVGRSAPSADSLVDMLQICLACVYVCFNCPRFLRRGWKCSALKGAAGRLGGAAVFK